MEGRVQSGQNHSQHLTPCVHEQKTRVAVCLPTVTHSCWLWLSCLLCFVVTSIWMDIGRCVGVRGGEPWILPCVGCIFGGMDVVPC